MKRWELEVAYGKLQRENDELRSRLGRQAVEIGDLREQIAQQAQIIKQQAEENAALKAQVEELRRAGHRQAGRFRRDPDKLSQDPKPPGRKAGEGKWSNRAAPTDEQKAKAATKASQLAGCPCCGGELTDVREHEHYEWDTPPVTPTLTRFVSQSGYCAQCGRRVRSRHPDQISEATGAAGVIIGPHAKALASDMKHSLGVSYGKISDFFAEVYRMPVARATWFARTCGWPTAPGRCTRS